MSMWGPVDKAVMMDMPEGSPDAIWNHLQYGPGYNPEFSASAQASVQPAIPKSGPDPIGTPDEFSHNSTQVQQAQAQPSQPNLPMPPTPRPDPQKGLIDRIRDTADGLPPWAKRGLKGGFGSLGGSASKAFQREMAQPYEEARSKLWNIYQPSKLGTAESRPATQIGATRGVNAEELHRYWLERLREFASIKQAVGGK